MATYHCQVKPVSRSAGRSATAAAAYRTGELVYDERTREAHDYRRRGGVEHTEIVAPEGAEWARDRNRLWNRAEAAERRKDARIARDFEVALPVELSPAERRELALEFARELVDRYGVVADVAIHAPSKRGDQRNHHAHILCTTRQATAGGLGEKAVLELSDKKLRSQGLPEGRQQVEQIREQWAGACNRALARAGVEARVDHRSLVAQGITDRAPGLHLGPTATAMERRGLQTDRGDQQRERQQVSREIAEIARELSAAIREQQAERREARRVIEGDIAAAQAQAEVKTRWGQEHQRALEEEAAWKDVPKPDGDLGEMMEWAGKDARIRFRAELARRGEWEPRGCQAEIAAVEAARKKAMDQWRAENSPRIDAGDKGIGNIPSPPETLQKATPAQPQTPTEIRLALEAERRQWVEEHCPALLDEARQTAKRLQERYDALTGEIEAHRRAKPSVPEEPEKPWTLFGFALPGPYDRWAQQCEQYDAARAAKADWEKTGKQLSRERETVGRQVREARAILESRPDDTFSPLWNAAIDRAQRADPGRWAKLRKEIGEAISAEHRGRDRSRQQSSRRGMRR